jgi:hypothetical protein
MLFSKVIRKMRLPLVVSLQPIIGLPVETQPTDSAIGCVFTANSFFLLWRATNMLYQSVENPLPLAVSSQPIPLPDYGG